MAPKARSAKRRSTTSKGGELWKTAHGLSMGYGEFGKRMAKGELQ